MKQSMKELILVIVSIGILFILYLISSIGSFSSKLVSGPTIVLFLVMLFSIFCFVLVQFVKGNGSNKYKEKVEQSLFDNNDTVYLLFDSKLKTIIYMTDNLFSVLEIPKEHLSETQVVMNFLDTPIIQNVMREWKRNEEFVSPMVSYHHPSYHNPKWFRIRIYPRQEKKERFYIMILSDATKEHDQQHLLVTQASDIKMREQQLNQITATAYDMEWDVDLNNGTLRSRNLKESISYFGEERTGEYSDILPELVRSYVAPEDQEQVIESLLWSNLSELVEQKKLEPITIRYRLDNQSKQIWLESTVFFVVNKRENHATILTKNVTADAEYMRKQNLLLQNALRDAEKSNKEMSEFLRIMSHEIRTPMNAIIGLSESALMEDIPKMAREDLENINSASNNLLQVIDGLLDLSKVEQGTIHLEEKEYSVPILFQDVEGIIHEWIGAKEIEFIAKIDTSIPKSLFGDVTKINRILLNVLDNAVKYTDRGRIFLEARSQRESRSRIKLILTIEDSGIGMDQDTLDHLFDSNSGKGLTITKQLIDALKGSVSVESIIGKGSVFTITISQQIRDEKELGIVAPKVKTTKTTLSFNATDKSILVIDDNSLNLKVATRLLEPYDAKVTTVQSGKQGIDLVGNGAKFDLILLDQMMPEMDGVTTLHLLKKLPGFDIPVIVLTADAIVGKKEEYLREGFDDFLSKPINTTELYKLLKKYLKK